MLDITEENIFKKLQSEALEHYEYCFVDYLNYLIWLIRDEIAITQEGLISSCRFHRSQLEGMITLLFKMNFITNEEFLEEHERIVKYYQMSVLEKFANKESLVISKKILLKKEKEKK